MIFFKNLFTPTLASYPKKPQYVVRLYTVYFHMLCLYIFYTPDYTPCWFLRGIFQPKIDKKRIASSNKKCYYSLNSSNKSAFLLSKTSNK